MAMEQYFQEAVAQNSFNKEDEASLEKWKSVSETVNGCETNHSGGFDCNICLDKVQDPVVTLCGHLYCWPCIYKWIHYQTTSPEYQQPQCPVCKTDISQKTLVPLYGRGQTTKPSKAKAPHLGMAIPRRPSSPRCGIHNPTTTATSTSPRPRGYPQYLQTVPMPNLGGMTMANGFSPTTAMFGEMVYARIFGNSETSLYTYRNSYNLAGISTVRARRQAMQADTSLSRVCFFLLCCIVLCLLLF